jgi:hypothetical protein
VKDHVRFGANGQPLQQQQSASPSQHQHQVQSPPDQSRWVRARTRCLVALVCVHVISSTPSFLCAIATERWARPRERLPARRVSCDGRGLWWRWPAPTSDGPWTRPRRRWFRSSSSGGSGRARTRTRTRGLASQSARRILPAPILFALWRTSLRGQCWSRCAPLASCPSSIGN